MTSIIVQGLDDSVKQQLAKQAKEHGHSLENEIRDILTSAAGRPHIGLALLQAAQGGGGVDDLAVPDRSDMGQKVDFAEPRDDRTPR